ncbi:MAG: type VI secretion protein IcmF/TssM N-terminal domain-containing protein, partial [Planctomycetota bacterium]
PIKLGVVGIIGGGILVGMFYLIPVQVLWIVFIGLGLVALLLFLYWRLLKWLNKRKAAPMENGVIQNTAVTPQGVSEAANLARLDDLRKKFEEGIAQFRAAGKSLYNFPWYMIVGEPGSGKTEAIRHCNVGFPPGLQDQFQGAGGTLNMNWWFTDYAVVLDTAGRLMFEEVETGGSSEWKEFLKLLKKYRPQCPMNGVFLVIPADSLIKDTADEIEQKASKIARQFDMIQRTLDVRFPVFVVITKSDLINGFRDFFDNLEDPQLQHQILGWSNPAQLDEPYNPDFIDQHLKSIKGRLFRRRLALLQEIVSDAGEPGVEQMRSPDTLYAFPQSLAKIVPRMARYLELIFSVGSQWSCKPLFFRGIYFTSSMREGSALDEDLAESLGMSVDALPDGRVWERDRAYFLRDLFLKKVFCEKGLVTDATNAKKQHMRRKAAVLFSAVASVVLLLFCTVYAAICFRRSIGEMKEYFEVPSKLIASGGTRASNQLQVIKDEGQGLYRYIGRAGIPEMPEDVTRSDFSARLAKLVEGWEKEGVPWIFAPAATFAKGIQSEKFTNAQAVVYETGVLRPFLDAAAQTMSSQQDGKWTRQNPDIHVLRQFIRLKANRPFNKEAQYSSEAILDALFEYIFKRDEVSEDEEGFAKLMTMYNEDKASLHEPVDFIYAGTLSPTYAKNDPNFLEAAIDRGVARFNAYWSDSNQVGVDSRDFAQAETIERLTGAFEQFDVAEQDILTLQSRFNAESDKLYLDDNWGRFASGWERSFKALQRARDDIQRLATTLKNPSSLGELWGNVAQNTVKDVNDHYRFLLAELENDRAQNNPFLMHIRVKLETVYGNIRNRLFNSELEDKLRVIDERFYAQARQGDCLYELRFRMYDICNDLFAEAELYPLYRVRSAIVKADEDIGEANRVTGELTSLGSTAYRFQEAAGICRFTTTANQQRQLFSILDQCLKSAPKSVKDVGDLIEEQGKWDWTGVPAEIVDRRYDPEFTEELVGGWKAVGISLQRLPKETRLQQEFSDVNAVYSEYPRLYFDYWLGTVPESMIRSRVDEDSQQFKSLIVRNVFDELVGGLGVLLEKAATPLRPYASPDEEKISQFDANLGKVRDRRTYDKVYRECRAVLDNWRTLSDDMSVSRGSLLRVTPADYLEDYAPFSYASPAEFVDMYWAELSLQLLGILSTTVQRRGNESFENLKTRFGGKFPLERDSQANVTREELAEAWSGLNDVRLQELFAQGTIGSGAKTGSDDIDERLQLLHGVDLSEPYRQWFEGIEKVFKGLPQAEDPYYCRITLLGQNKQRTLVEQDEQLLLDYLTEFRIVQGDSKSGRLNTRSREDLSVGMFGYPGRSLNIEFYQYPSDTEMHTSVEFPQPWSTLRMLHQCYDGRKQGYVKLEVESDKALGGVLFLQLDFYRDIEGKYELEFPSLEQWPSLKSKR